MVSGGVAIGSRCGTFAIVASEVILAQSEKFVSSYGPTNQDTTFGQIKTARLAVKAERFYVKELAGGMMMAADGPIKTFPPDQPGEERSGRVPPVSLR
jgi:hypothetical protein